MQLEIARMYRMANNTLRADGHHHGPFAPSAVLGVCCVLIGALTFTLATPPPVLAVGLVAVGLVLLGWAWLRAPELTLVLERDVSEVRILRRGRESGRHPFSAIGWSVEVGHSTEGVSSFCPVVTLPDGEKVWLQPSCVLPEDAEAVVAEVRRWMAGASA